MTALADVVQTSPDPLARLTGVAALRARLDAVERVAAAEARAGGRTWDTIGESLGVTKQAAAKRLGPAAEGAPAPAVKAVKRAARGDKEAEDWEVTTLRGRRLFRLRRAAGKQS